MIEAGVGAWECKVDSAWRNELVFICLSCIVSGMGFYHEKGVAK